jgi:hypothetical protein
MNFIWNTKKIKTIVANPEGRVQLEMTPKQIIEVPNRQQFEPIISALCITVSELVKIQEEQAARISQLMQKQSPEKQSSLVEPS